MKPHELILKLIEEVDPSDTAKLDEIDARVWCWLQGAAFGKVSKHGGKVWVLKDGNGFPDGGRWYWLENPYVKEDAWDHGFINFRYTRSRDALKAIRPEGWNIETRKSISGRAECRQIIITVIYT